MLKDYLIVAYLTVIQCWPVSLPVMAVMAAFLLYKGHWPTALLLAFIFVWIAIGSWQLEHNM